MACQLTAAGEAVALLVLFDSLSPPGTAYRPEFSLRYHLDRLREAPVAYGKYMARRLLRRVGLPLRPPAPASAPAVVQVAAAHTQAWAAQKPKSWPGRAVVFVNAEDQSCAALWSEVLGPGLELQVVPGNHWSVWSPANLGSWLPRLHEVLARAAEPPVPEPAAGAVVLPSEAGRWKRTVRKQGVQAFRRDGASDRYPCLRAVVRIPQDAWQVLAVRLDAERYPQWMHGVVHSELLEEPRPGLHLAGHRLCVDDAAPARAVVVRAEAALAGGGRQLCVTLQSQAGKGSPEPGAPRLEALHGSFCLHFVAGGQTLVDYQLDLDPGTLLPEDVLERLCQDLAAQTLAGLRRQAKRTAGRHGEQSARLRQVLAEGRALT